MSMCPKMSHQISEVVSQKIPKAKLSFLWATLLCTKDQILYKFVKSCSFGLYISTTCTMLAQWKNPCSAKARSMVWRGHKSKGCVFLFRQLFKISLKTASNVAWVMEQKVALHALGFVRFREWFQEMYIQACYTLRSEIQTDAPESFY